MGEMPDIFEFTLSHDLRDLIGAPRGPEPVKDGLIALLQVKGIVQRARNAIKDHENDFEAGDSLNKLCETIEYLASGLNTYYMNQIAIVPQNIDPKTAEVMAACLDEKVRELKVKWDYLSGGLGKGHHREISA